MAASLAETESPKITVSSCIIGAGGNGRLGVEIGFRNDSTETLKSLTWRAAIAGGSMDFADDNGIEPGVAATHILYQRRIIASKAYYLNDATNCWLVRTQTSDGREWKSPDFGESNHWPTLFPSQRPDDAPPVPATIDNPTHDPVGIVSCFYYLSGPIFFRKLGSGTLVVRFRNLAPQALEQVVFRAPYLSGGFDFIDGGTFSPGVLISSDRYVNGVRLLGRKLTRDLPADLPGEYATFTDKPENCETVSARFADGSVWQNPSAGPTEPPMPTPPPTLPPN